MKRYPSMDQESISSPSSYTASSTGSKFRPSTTNTVSSSITSVNVDYGMPSVSQTTVDNSA